MLIIFDGLCSFHNTRWPYNRESRCLCCFIHGGKAVFFVIGFVVRRGHVSYVVSGVVGWQICFVLLASSWGLEHEKHVGWAVLFSCSEFGLSGGVTGNFLEPLWFLVCLITYVWSNGTYSSSIFYLRWVVCFAALLVHQTTCTVLNIFWFLKKKKQIL